ncbi:radical SAM/SPASM domain-containing protein [Paenibacillus paeoniae]|uniref:Radical SAM protein n=1 Tax=Paenibacillus paeoniae TaxID=2292705 RepID=A0A371P7W3_9BACL|nr:radical SAM protein [Paenibacillus paeoniae]REK71608.1 radical SAM protein [Paenibacillus paeoniae]
MELHLPFEEEALSVFLKLPGEVCNINCHYCYEKRKPSGPYKNINADMLSEFLKKANKRPLALELHGGEPLIIGKEKMLSLIRECQKYEGPIRLKLQTNLILLDQEWIDLLKTEWPEIEISTSLDGDPASTKHRVDYLDRPTYKQVEKSLRLLEANEMKIGLICTVTKPALKRSKQILDYFMGFSCISLLKINPCFDFNVMSPKNKGNIESIEILNPNGEGVPGWGITPLEFSSFLKELFDYWTETQRYKELLLEPFLSIIRVVGGKHANFCVYNQFKCANMLSLYPDGRVGSCDELDSKNSLLSYLKDFESLDDIIHFQTNKPLHDSLNELLEKCEDCDYKNTCNGGCLATRGRFRGSNLYEEYCDYRISIIEHVKSKIS